MAQPHILSARSLRRTRMDAPAKEMPHLTRYVANGHPVPVPDETSVAEALAYAQGGPDTMAALFYPTPTPAAIAELADAWELHPLLREDLLNANQRPKLERYGEVLFMVVRSARYLDDAEEVEFAEFHILLRPHAVAVVAQSKRWIDGSDGTNSRNLLADGYLLGLGPEAVVYGILDAIVDGYGPVIQGLSIDKEQIERQVFSGDAAVAERIYRLSQEVIDTQHAVSSLRDVLHSLRAGFGKYEIPEELQTYLQNVSDHLTRIGGQVSELRDALSQILSVNSTLIAQRQNEDMKKISGWAAILFAPTLIAAVYGMNFDVMPEIHWAFGYPLAITLMVGFALMLFLIFKRSKWM